MKPFRLLCLLLALPVLALAAESGTVKKGAVAAQLVSDTAVIVPGQPFTVALRLQHDPHWHSYWLAAGTGYPTAITWTLPAGFKAGEIQWPTPHILRDSANKVVGNGYSDESYLLVEITPACLSLRPPGPAAPKARAAGRSRTQDKHRAASRPQR